MSEGQKKGRQLVTGIKTGRIKKDLPPDVGGLMDEKTHLTRFTAYLGSCSRYLLNKAIRRR